MQGPASAIIVFLLVWWLVLFTVLPLRIKGVWEDESGQPKGADRGAPINPALWFKIKRTTWIAALVWIVVMAVIWSGVISYER